MEIRPGDLAKISRSSRRDNYQPRLKLIGFTKEAPIKEILLSDGDNALNFLLDGSIAPQCTPQFLPPNSILELTNYEVIADQPKTVKLLGFRTKDREFGPQPMVSKPAPVADVQFVPIAMLNPHNPDFIIKGRIVGKSDIKHWNKNGRQGKFFHIEIIDQAQETIDATFFQQGCDKFYNALEEGKVYLFAKGAVKYQNTRYNTTTSKYALTFDERAHIMEVADDSNIKKDSINLTKLDQIEKLGVGSRVDVAGVVQRCTPITDIISKSGDTLKKRTVYIVDDTKTGIELSLWNDSAKLPEFDHFNETQRMVLVAKNVRVSDFNGISLSSINGMTCLSINPQELADIRSLWAFDTRDCTPLSRTPEVRSLSIKPITAILREMEAKAVDSEHYFDVLGSIRYIKRGDNRPFYYESCKKCRKKMMLDGNVYVCHGCNISSADCDYRYNLLIRIQDATHSIFVTSFDEASTKLIKKPAEEMKRLQDHSPEEFDDQFKTLDFKEFLFRIKGKNEVSRLDSSLHTRFTIQSVSVIDPVRIGKALVNEITNSLNLMAVTT